MYGLRGLPYSWIWIAIFGCCVLSPCTMGAQPQNPHHGFLGGPWEVVVKMGHEGDALRLPLLIADENKSQVIDTILPVRGTPLKVRIQKYLPDLAWETTAVEDPNGGPAAKLSIKGENLNQELWLCARDAGRHTVSSHIGGVSIRELPVTDQSANALNQLTEADVVGIVYLWLPGHERPQAYAVKPGMSVQLPDGQGTLSVQRYIPHYSIDRETKEVVSLSEAPINPALQITLTQGQTEHSQWLWSKFASSPHNKQALPFAVKFVDFHVGQEPGQYILAMAEGLEPKLFHVQDGQRRVESVQADRLYPFKDQGYSFSVDHVYAQARIETQWKNNSEMLLHPAVVAAVGQGDAYQETVLELNKPYHHKTKQGTLVVFYRRVP